MTAFFETYKEDILYAAIIIASVFVLRFLTNLLHKWLLKQELKKYPGESPKAVNWVKRILNALWLVLGIILLVSLFVGEEREDALQQNFKLILYLAVVAIITIVAAASTNMWFRMRINLKIENREDPTSFKFLRYVAIIGIYSVGVLFALLAFPSLKGVAQTALGGAGVIALIAGVASQEALANLVGGVFIISFKPFRIGDIIKVTDTMVGTVTDITLRHTVIRNFENKMIVIPNAIINKEKLINYDLGELKICDRIEIGISYDSDIDLAKKIMQEECMRHPLILDNRSEIEILDGQPIVRVALTSLNDFSVTIRAWVWARDYSDSFNMRCDLLESIKKRFDREGIEIPFPYRTVVFKNTASEPERTEDNPEKKETEA
ncbi:mechanosensitive ion channel family protein [Aequorivita vladivostokensis]|uniref:Mechanosensitive ion channel protein MscS n=1 Tax=Aequorivita vladivostokensis TaxID=171194 RepID=A0ABR5DI47_9FLAO|nr:mechanosensitive ion channel family protein [Aequorivita vladivostokensis]KJJ38449.1 mechanosensitive ion channel protein MscS [Aequorivita vladivostokensis]MAB58422.1 mechanosensitive ion channel family protein [Aequorivita sp.]MBF29832.1 mechanosensitive ion channel family protein [Aequorivita sp.]|tara:strand:+ start:5435 stop:6568 length:1134 start_codon:yes stop_codon:yes gene_type:complete